MSGPHLSLPGDRPSNPSDTWARNVGSDPRRQVSYLRREDGLLFDEFDGRQQEVEGVIRRVSGAWSIHSCLALVCFSRTLTDGSALLSAVHISRPFMH